MKKYIYLFFLIGTLGCGEVSNEQAKVYNEKINEHVNKVTTEYGSMVVSYNDEDYETAEKHLNNCKRNCDASYDFLTKLGGFNGDETFVTAVKRGLAIYKSILKNEYPKMLEKAAYISNPDNIESYSKNVNINLIKFAGELEGLAEKANAKAAKGDSVIYNTQLHFFDKYGLRLEE